MGYGVWDMCYAVEYYLFSGALAFPVSVMSSASRCANPFLMLLRHQVVFGLILFLVVSFSFYVCHTPIDTHPEYNGHKQKLIVGSEASEHTSAGAGKGGYCCTQYPSFRSAHQA